MIILILLFLPVLLMLYAIYQVIIFMLVAMTSFASWIWNRNQT